MSIDKYGKYRDGFNRKRDWLEMRDYEVSSCKYWMERRLFKQSKAFVNVESDGEEYKDGLHAHYGDYKDTVFPFRRYVYRNRELEDKEEIEINADWGDDE